MSTRKPRRPSSQNSVGDHYEVGYGKPPRSSQFRKGGDRPPGSGRRKRLQIETKGQVEELLIKELNRPVRVREGEVVSVVTTLEVGLRSWMQKVRNGDEKAIRAVLDMIERRLPAMKVLGIQLEIVPTRYEGLDDAEAERRALEDLDVIAAQRAAKR